MIKERIIFGIDRKEISHFTSIELHQTINNHHTFTIKVPHSVIEKPRAYTMENAQSWMWKVVHIALENKNNFLGIITNIELDFNLDHVGSQIILTGFSKTILLESGTNLHSWEDTTLQDMVREVIKSGADEQLQNDIQPEFTNKINYQTQYNETDFQYIQRLAKQYNEWLYYDGEKLFFGKPQNLIQKERITLTFGQDLYTFKLGVKAKQTQFGAYTYNEESNKLYQAKTQHKVEGLPRMGDQAFDASEKLYNTASLEYGRIPTGDEGFLETILKKRQEAAMADANYITATSGNNKLKIGSIITINAREGIDVNKAHRLDLDVTKTNFQLQEIGTYIITEINHKATDIGEYKNSFKALPAFIKTLPEPQIAFPQAQNQQAIVIDNADPKGQGRIRVKMQWQQTKNLRTQWIRVMTPDAGTSGEVPTNRGMVFIPEVGDHVMLGFRYNDPNRPFVLGSLFNGQTGIGGQANNNIKSIFTKTGSTITFDEGASSILVKDPSGNTWFMDGAGNINVTAPNLLTLNATDISVNASNNLTTNVGNVMTFNVVKNAFFNIFQKMQVNTPYLHQLISGLFHTNASKALINSDNEIKLESPEMYVAGQKKLFLHSDEQTIVNSEGTVKVDGTKGNKQSNEGDSYETNKEEIIAKCVVHFRPHDTYKNNPNFGFDWLRAGDSGQKGDVWFGKIMGRYFQEATFITPFKNTNSWSKFFNKEMGMYDKLLKTYRSMVIPWKGSKKKPYLYPIPVLTLLKGKTATFNLKIEIAEKPKKMTFEFKDKSAKDFLSLNIKEIGDIRDGKYDKFNYLKITCNKSFDTEQVLYVKADDEICGAMRIHPNSAKFRKEFKAVFIKVMTNVNSESPKKGIPKEGGKDFYTACFNQALVEPVFSPEIKLDCEGNFLYNSFRSKFCTYGDLSKTTKGYKVTNTSGMRDYLLDELKDQFGDVYDDHYKVFFIGEKANWNGFSNFDSKFGVQFGGHNPATIAHESMHAMNLPHTFASRDEGKAIAKFTYEATKTNNLLDYSHVANPPIERFSLFHWQWQILNPKIK